MRVPFLSSSRVLLFSLTIAFAVGGLIIVGCSRSPKTSATNNTDTTIATAGWFQDVTASSGLDFLQDPGPTGTYFMPQSMGTGVATFDADGDGLLDVYLLNFGGPNAKTTNRFFRQTAPLKFEDRTAGSGLGVAGHFHGVTIGDANNDGKPDVLINGYQSVKLLVNQGDGRFTDVTETSGLVNLTWGVSAAWLDYDRDGWLDLLLVNYLDHDPKVECRSPEGVRDFCGPNSYTGTSSKLFRNLGQAKLQFEDVSLASGIGKVRGPGLGLTVADFDGDGWVDVFVSNDGKPNRLWMNQKNSTFSEEAVSRGVAMTAMGKAFAGMGVALGDVDGDGMLDLYVTHLGIEQNNLWRQHPRGHFRDRTAEMGLTTSAWRGTGFGTLMADFNHDGHVDIAIANGKVYRGPAVEEAKLGFWNNYVEKNQLFVNDGHGKFTDVSAEQPELCGYWNVARGLVCADFDNDGAPDLLVAPIGDRAKLFRNVAPKRGHWLKVQAIDPARKRDAYGAEIRVKTTGREFVRLINPAESYLSSGSPIAHFGLGDAEQIEWVRVTWPDGNKVITETFAGGAVDRLMVLKRGEGKP